MECPLLFLAFSLSTVGAAILSVAFLLFLLLWIYLDRTEAGKFERHRNPTVYVCVRCSHVYASAENRRKAVCPECGHVNIPLRF